MDSSNGLAVIVWTTEEEAENGVLRVEEDGLSIRLRTGEIITNPTTVNVFYTPREGSIINENRIIFNPVLIVKRPYLRDVGQLIEDVFPPSTGGFYGRMKSGIETVIYIIQRIEKESRKWLLIGDPKTGRVLESQVIHDYEVEAIRLFDNQEHQKKWDSYITQDEAEPNREELLSVLTDSSPTWEDISKLISDVTIPNLKLEGLMRDTLSQLVPKSFPKQIREELMAFLAYTIKPEILMEDPVNFSFRAYSLPLFSNLIRGHQRCVSAKSKWPPYIKYLKLAERKQLQQPIATLHAHLDSPWDIFRQKVNELFPNWIGTAIDSAKELNKADKIVTRIPATFSRAKKSKKVWRERLAAVSYGLRIRGHINFKSIGLTELLYLGAAYRWPHRHMKFIAKLGISSENPPHIHVMTMPQTAAERIKRFLPSVTEVAWSIRSVNLDLYNQELESWVIPVDQITRSISNESSLRKLDKRFRRKASRDMYQMSKDDAIVAGLASRGIYLVDFEREGRFKYWGLKKKQVHSVLSDLYNQGVMDAMYDVEDARLVSIATLVQGESRHLISLTEALLGNTPTSLAMLNKRADLGVIISTFTEGAAYEVTQKIPKYGLENDLVVRCMRPTAFRNYTLDLYQRLLRDDDTWDDDVSAFLSQARSKKKELSESNA
ncbi:MAG: hypothetical protein ACFFCX_11355 [Candidatus Sifarchaeia archaeon]